MSEGGETTRKRGRRWAILGILLAALILLVLLLPAIAAPIVKGKVESAIEDELAVEAAIADLSFTLGGSVALRGVHLEDLEGRTVLELEAADLSVGVLRALTGTYAFDAEARGLVVRLYEEQDGSWSVEDLPRAKEPKEKKEPSEPRALELYGSARLPDAKLVLVRRDGPALEATLAANAAFDGPDAPARVEGALALSTGGRALVAAEIPGDPGRLGDVARLSASGSLRFDPPIDVGALGAALGELAPVELRGGSLSGSGDLSLGPQLDLNLTAGFALERLELVGPRAGAAPTRIERIAIDASTAPAPDGAGLAPRVAVRVDDALELALDGRLTGAGAPDARLAADLSIGGDVGALARLAAGWAALKPGLEIEGKLAGGGTLEVALAEDALATAAADLRVALEGLAARDAQGPIDLGELGAPRVELDARYDARAATLELVGLALEAGPVHATASAALSALDAATPRIERASADATADLDALARSLAGLVDLGETRLAGALKAHLEAAGADAVAIGLTGRDVAIGLPDVLALTLGSLRADVRASGLSTDAIALASDGELLLLDLALAPAAPEPSPEASEGAAEPPRQPIQVSEPRVVFALDALAAPERGDLDLRTLHVESQALQGDVTGRLAGLRTLADPAPDVAVEALRADLVYVPDRLAAALGPLIPGELTGATPEPLKVSLDGRLRGLDAAACVAGLDGSIDVGVGRYRQTGLDVGGRAHVELKEGKATWTGALQANGGELALAGELAVEPGATGLVARDPKLSIGADDVAANASMGPLLGFVHPAFGGLDAVAKNQLGGLIDCDVDLAYEGDLDVATLAAGWDALPKEPIQGSVTFSLADGTLTGSPLVQKLLESFDLGGVKEFALKPMRLDVKDGRVSYPSPWEWAIGGTTTAFSGSIGLDQTLDLEWAIPITGDLVARNSFLKSLQGQTIRIPLSGTVTKPKLEVEGLLSSLVKDNVKTGVQDLLKGKSGADGEDAGALLARADALWDQGDKKGAAELYRRIEKDFKLSLVYLTNKSRIKDRADWKP